MTKTGDFWVVSGILLFCAAIWVGFDLKPLWGGGFLFALLPAFYLGMRVQKPWAAISASSIVLGFLLGGFFDFLQSYNHAWSVDRLVIPWKVFGVMPLDNALGYFLMTFLTLVFYEHFSSGRTSLQLGSKFLRRSAPIVIAIAVLLTLFFFESSFLNIPYPYVVGGSLAVLITVIGALRHRELIVKMTSVAGFFFFVWFLAEICAVYTGGWSYPGTQYMGWVTLASIRFPFEELFFWMIWYAPFIVVTYEYLVRRDSL